MLVLQAATIPHLPQTWFFIEGRKGRRPVRPAADDCQHQTNITVYVPHSAPAPRAYLADPQTMARVDEFATVK